MICLGTMGRLCTPQVTIMLVGVFFSAPDTNYIFSVPRPNVSWSGAFPTFYFDLVTSIVRCQAKGLEVAKLLLIQVIIQEI